MALVEEDYYNLGLGHEKQGDLKGAISDYRISKWYINDMLKK